MAELLIRKQTPIAKYCIFLSIFFASLSFIALNLNIHQLFIMPLYCILGYSIVFIFVNLPVSICKNKIHILVESLGIKSYTIYICHFPIISLISAWSIEVLGGRPIEGWLAVGGGIFTLIISYLLFFVCEYNFLHSRIKT